MDMAQLLIILLQGAGAQVAWVAQAEEALVVLARVQPDILISNIKLPYHDGDWLIRQIRNQEMGQAHHLPAIALSSYTREVGEEQMHCAGFERFLWKLDHLDEVITEILKLVPQAQ